MTNPIIQRELIGMLRSRKALAIMLALPAVLGLLLVGRWPSAGRVGLEGAESMQVLRVFGYGLMVGLILLAPVFPATSIVRERVQGSLALLLNSPLSPAAIVLGKLISAVGYVLLLIILSIPAAAACSAMGGVYLVEQLLPMYVVLFMLAISYASLGLLVSSWAARPDSALRLTYGLILLLALVSMAPHFFLAGNLQAMPLAVTASEWLRCISPLPAMMEVLGDLDVTSGGQQPAAGVAVRYVGFSVLLTIVCAAWTYRRLGQRLLDRARDAGQMTEDRSERAQLLRRVLFLWFFDPQRRSELIGFNAGRAVGALVGGALFAVAAVALFLQQMGVLFNIIAVALGFVAILLAGTVVWQFAAASPVTVKEQKCNRFGRGNWMMRLIMGCLIVSLLLMLATATSARDQAEQIKQLGGVMVLLQVTLVILITPSLASGLISTEIESRSWQLLQMTPLSPLRIVRGKLLSVAMTLGLILLATLPGYAVLMVIDDAMWPVILRVLVSLALTAAMALMISAAVSSCVANTAASTAIAYTLLIGQCIGTLLFWLGEGAPFGRDMVERVLTVNPLAGALNLIEAPGFESHRYQLIPANWWIIGGICVAAALVLTVRTWQLTRPR